MLSCSITVGCTGGSRVKQVVYQCDQPELRGPTWADVAILSIDQKASIEICNTLNGTSDYKLYRKEQ